MKPAKPKTCSNGAGHTALCNTISVVFERIADGESLRSVERDYGLCPGTLDPISEVRKQAQADICADCVSEYRRRRR